MLRSPVINCTLIMDPGLSVGVAHMRAGRTSRGKALGRFQTQGTKLRSEGIEGGARESGEGDGRGDVQQFGVAGGRFQAARQETREILSGEQGRQRNFVTPVS